MKWLAHSAVKNPIVTRLKTDGEMFWVYHLLTLMMNSVTSEERIALVQATETILMHLSLN